MRTRAGLLVIALCGCNPITQPPGSLAPVNVCNGTSGLTCGGYPSDAGVWCESMGPAAACQVNAIDPFVLVVTIPALAPVAAGTTYAISSEQLFGDATYNACNTPPAVEPPQDVCFKMGPVQAAGGVYVIDEAQAREAGRNLGNTSSTTWVTLPVAVTFWPQWTPPHTATSAGVLTDARLLNLPLPPIFADVGSSVGDNWLEFTEDIAMQSPGGSGPPLEWIAGLPPSTAGLSQLTSHSGYVAEVEVSAPFDDGYPDVSYSVATNSPPLSKDGTNLGFAIGWSSGTQPITIERWPLSPASGPQLPPLTVKHANKQPFIGGWTVYLRDPNTLRALSSRATLAGVESPAPLNLISTQVPGPNAEIVIEPPPDIEGFPEFVDPNPTSKTSEVYPALPPRMHVSGTVVSPDGAPVSATLLFFSSALYGTTTCGTTKCGTMKCGAPALLTTLHYEARVRTADRVSSGGAVGSYSVELPQGHYGVVVDPGGSTAYAKTTNEFETVVATPDVCDGGTSPSMNLDVDVSPAITVSGSFVTGDGRALAAASVDFTPASALAGRAILRDQWPRPFTTTTDVTGAFSIAVDPGEYDITVRPQDGTGLPWLVRPDHIVMNGMQSLEPITVPAPFFLSATLHIPEPADTSAELPVTQAVVQAYAFSNGVALLIGDALTDDDGHFTMMLSTAFPRE